LHCGQRFLRVVAYALGLQIFICQQLVEPIGGIMQPGRRPDRNGKTVCGELAGQYHSNDGAGTEVGGMVIVFYRFESFTASMMNVMFHRLRAGVWIASREFAARARRAATPRSIEESDAANKLLLTARGRHHTHIG
jgi:hypothetical protein